VAKKDKKKGKLKQKLTDKYRLVVLNEDTFEERFSLKLSRLNVFVLGGLFSILLVAATTVLIAFTPLKEYIPGFASSALKIKVAKLTFEADSLKIKVGVLENYTKALKPILTGEIQAESVDSIKYEARKRFIDLRKLNASKEDSLFRDKIERDNRFSLEKNRQSNVKVVFFAPLNGENFSKIRSNIKTFCC
jgi:type IV secretory pathway component VirB8